MQCNIGKNPKRKGKIFNQWNLLCLSYLVQKGKQKVKCMKTSNWMKFIAI